MPLTFRDYLKNDGWIPLHSFHGNHTIADGFKDIDKHRKHRRNGEIELLPSVKKLKDLVEKDPDLYMGFTDMFKEAGRSSLVGGATMTFQNYIDGFLGPKLYRHDKFDR